MSRAIPNMRAKAQNDLSSRECASELVREQSHSVLVRE